MTLKEIDMQDFIKNELIKNTEHTALIFSGKRNDLRRQHGLPITKCYEFKVVAKDGTVKWIDLSGEAIVSNAMKTAIVSVLDITGGRGPCSAVTWILPSVKSWSNPCSKVKRNTVR